MKSHLSDDRKCSTLEKRGGRKFVVSRSPFSNKRCFLLSSCIEQTTREWRISKKNQRIRRRISRRSRFSSRMLKVQASRIVLADVIRIEIKKSSNSIRKECKKYRSSSRFFFILLYFYPLSFFILFFLFSRFPIKRKHRNVSVNVETRQRSIEREARKLKKNIIFAFVNRPYSRSMRFLC